MTFLFKSERGRPPVTCETVRVGYEEKTRVVSERYSEALGATVRQVAGDGWDRSALRIAPGQIEGGAVQGAKLPDGRPARGGRPVGARRVANTAAGVKTVLRRLRPEEAAELARIDADLADLQEQIDELRRVREVQMAIAWDKAHVVRLNELDPQERTVY